MNTPFSPRRNHTPLRSLPKSGATIRLHRRHGRIARLADWCNDHRHIVMLIVGMLLIGGWWHLHQAPTTPPKKESQPAQTASSKKTSQKTYTDTTPKFATLLPAGKTIESLGGWTRVSPETSEPVFAYKDTLDNTPIIVSQQPLPSSFTDSKEDITELARQYNATERLPFAGGTAFVGTSAKGPQSVIATKNNLLILIKSTVKHTDDSWVQYLSTLH